MINGFRLKCQERVDLIKPWLSAKAKVLSNAQPRDWPHTRTHPTHINAILRLLQRQFLPDCVNSTWYP